MSSFHIIIGYFLILKYLKPLKYFALISAKCDSFFKEAEIIWYIYDLISS